MLWTWQIEKEGNACPAELRREQKKQELQELRRMALRVNSSAASSDEVDDFYTALSLYAEKYGEPAVLS